MAAIRGEGEVIGVAADLHAADELPGLGVDHSQVVALVIDDPRRPPVRMEDDPVGLALTERNRADDLERVGVDDRGRLGLGVADEERRPCRRRGAAQHGGQEQNCAWFLHSYLT